LGNQADRLILLGRIVGLHGVQGEVKLESFTEPRLSIFKYRPWLLKSAAGEQEIDAARGRAQGKGLVAKLPGVDDRDAAAALMGSEVWVKRSALPKPTSGEVYWADLEGLQVVTTEGVSLGTVSHLFSTGANDVLVAKDGDRERLIPYVIGQFVQSVDLDGSRIVVDWDPEF
jgi:16S rRNA processing protein RimM